MAFTSEADGVRINIRVTPRGGRDSIEGADVLADGQAVLKVRVRAPADDGAANEAVTKLLAKTFGVPKSSVAIVSGASARRKVIRVKGDTTRLVAVVRSLFAKPNGAMN